MLYAGVVGGGRVAIGGMFARIVYVGIVFIGYVLNGDVGGL